MKKIVCLLSAVALTLLAVLGLVACDQGNTPPTPPAPRTITFSAGGQTEYVLVYQKGNNESLRRARNIVGELSALTGIERTAFVIIDDADTKTVTDGKEILIGETNRALSQVQKAYLADTDTKDFLWSIMTDNSRMALNANSDIGWDKLYDELATMMMGDKLVARANHKSEQVYTYEQYQLDLAAREAAELEKLKAELAVKIPALKELIADFDLEADFGGTGITSFAPQKIKDKIGDPTVNPTVGQHPRVLFTKDDLPGLRQALKNNPNLETALLKLVKTDINNGILPMATINSNGVYNYSDAKLNVIQAKALYYQITGIEYYGYEAILSIKNFIKTLGIGYYNSDQCRYFGRAVYITACVYDWCYDLLTEDDKLEIQVGVEEKLLKGQSGCEYQYLVGKLDDGTVLPSQYAVL